MIIAPARAQLTGQTRLAPPAAATIRAAVRLAGGREVCFVATVDEHDMIVAARVVARGDVRSVLALPGAARRGEMLVHNHPSGDLEPSHADLEVAARLHDGGIGFGIVDNDATDLYVVVEIPRAPVSVHLVPAAIDRDLGPDGPVATAHPAFEDRPSQRSMAVEVARLYNEGGVGLLEAGTGVGKSMGYLLPALRWAAANGERTVVSTNTINLQEQLVGKDLPFLERALGDQKVRFALLKGWRNYLCLMRLEQATAMDAALFEDGMQQEIAGIRAWSKQTRDGTLSDLVTPPRAEVWDEVAAEPDLCQRQRCPHYDACFLFAARRQAASADVIVANHHLLLSDVAVRRVQQNWEEAAVLPPYTRLVIDEGHHLEDAASAHLGITVTRRTLAKLFNRLDRKGKGLLNALLQKLGSQRDLLSAASLELVHSRLSPSVHAAREKGGLLFDLLDMVLEQSGEQTMRLTSEFAAHPVWRGGLDAALADLLGEVELLHDGLRIVRERLEGSTALDEALAPLLNEMRAVARRLQTAGDGLRTALQPAPDAPAMVRWIEVKGRDRNLSVTAVPLDLAPILREDLFERVTTTVVTSATLAADARFDFLAARLGLTEMDPPPSSAIYPSPFDYPRQAVLALPTDVAAPNVDAAAHFRGVMRALIDLAEAADGGLFVLFTSHRDVRQAASELRSTGADRRWPLLVHGEDSRDALLRRFRESGRAVLVGTASFWEGVDVPGRALRGLVIARLPFRVPGEPVTAAQCEAIESRGGDSFADYMLPHASLRLKQGFGRLIRTATDRGAIVIADPRVVTKRYGRGLLEALPPARRLIAPWASIAPRLREFYDS